MSDYQREIDKGEMFCVDMKEHYMKKLKHYLLSGALDIEKIEDDSFLLQKVVGNLIGEDFSPFSNEGKKLRRNLRHF